MSDRRYKIMIGPPGPNFSFGTVRGLLALTASKHDVELMPSGNGFDDFDVIWTAALNAAEEGKISHFAMLHLDIAPQVDDAPLWLDTLIDELDRLGLDMVSAVSPLKDFRGLTSCGIGDPHDPWSPYRRICIRELGSLPETFDAAALGHPDKPLLHNSGCWACDLRSPVFHQEDPDGTCGAYFAFPERVYRDKATGKWVHTRESEDWFFSRCLWKLQAKTAITRKVKLTHLGQAGYKNSDDWGQWEHDEGTAHKWNVPDGPWKEIPGWFDFADLYDERIAAVNGQPAHFVEVGSWLGKSAAYLASRIRESGKRIRLDCVDTWEGGTPGKANNFAGADRVAGRDLHAEFLANLQRCGVGQYVNPVRQDSTAAAANYADRSLDFVFIDADHELEAVRRDLAAWWPKLKPGGVLAGHDFDEPGPKRAAEELSRAASVPLRKMGRSFAMTAPGVA